MKIGLLDIDGHNFPNLALMKISSYHKSRGDIVEWYNGLETYDRVYKSKVFMFTSDDLRVIQAPEIIRGGTGYDIDQVLPDEIEHIMPDYYLYPVSPHYDTLTAYGFLTRGCPNCCPWCIVPFKEGHIQAHANIDEFLGNQTKAVLMDNNVLACEFGIRQIEKIIKKKLPIDFNQGLDARLIDATIAKLLAQVNWINYIRVACDTSNQIPVVEKAYNLLRRYGYTKRLFCYTIIRDLEESYKRISYFRNKKEFIPYAQPFRDFTNTPPKQFQKDMAHWTNKKSLFKSFDFKDFKVRNNFICKEYFNKSTSIH
ncbi:radical SAM protein [Butyricimonas virosa]|jgi:hypothetical protein